MQHRVEGAIQTEAILLFQTVLAILVETKGAEKLWAEKFKYDL